MVSSLDRHLKAWIIHLSFPGPGRVDDARPSFVCYGACSSALSRQHNRRCCRVPPQIPLDLTLRPAIYSDHTLTMVLYFDAGQQPPGVDAELAAAQPPGTAAPNVSHRSPAKKPVKCRFFTSRKGRYFSTFVP